MSLPWTHHLICGASIVKNYTFKIVETHVWKGDGRPYEFSLHVDWWGAPPDSRQHETGRLESVACRIETEADLDRWITDHNAFHTRWVNSEKGYRLRGPEEAYQPLVKSLGMRRRTYYTVVAQTPAHKKESWDGIPSGLFFYPKDRESRAECEAMVEELKRDLDSL